MGNEGSQSSPDTSFGTDFSGGNDDGSNEIDTSGKDGKPNFDPTCGNGSPPISRPSGDDGENPDGTDTRTQASGSLFK